MSEPLPIEAALDAAGDLLQTVGEHVAIVVVGGAAMNLLGIVRRSTSDVDVIARDFGLPSHWMNAEVGAQWVQGLPPWILDDITWRAYGNLDVGLVGRRTLIALKLFAAVDSGPTSVHAQDLLALAPTDVELQEAREWVMTQDAYEGFTTMISQVIEYVRRQRR